MAPVLELTSQAKETGGSQTVLSAVMAGTEDERLCLECGEGEGGFQGPYFTGNLESKEQGSKI